MRHHFTPVHLRCLLAAGLLAVGGAGCTREDAKPPARPPFASGRLLAATPVNGQSFTLDGIALDLLPIPAGTFRMGSPFAEPGHTVLESPQTWVTISRPYWLGRTAVTHEQWRTLMGTDLADQVRKAFPAEANPIRLLAGTADAVPMHFVTWREAMAFCARLNERARTEGWLPVGYEFTLPTEAQWEYACRAGGTDATYAGPLEVRGENNAPVLDAIAWYAGNSSVGYRGRGWDTADWPEKQYPGGLAGVRLVAQKQANAWGLHDMLGNVYQWCRDHPASALPGGAVKDPAGPARGADNIVRGGSWHSPAVYCRAAHRTWNNPDVRSQFIGFRIALAPIMPP
ncbi:MAG: formylglycine-generating enzyme family protein [Opitutaceae bacterium]|nr:formylglycine-generating enzyme family protein [Opitutaceae bacterium]